MTPQRPVSVRPAVALWAAVTAAGVWLVATLINQWIAAPGTGPVIIGLKPLIPATGPSGLAGIPAPWPFLVPLAAALALGSLLLALLPAVLGQVPRPKPLALFLAGWACVVAAAALLGALLALGAIVAGWPPARWSFIFSGVQPQVGAGAYWGLVWGWIPAAVAVLVNRHSTEAATAPSRRKSPAWRGTRAIVDILPALGFAVVLVAAISLAAAAPRATTPVASEPPPAPKHFGHPDVSAAVEEGAPGSAHPEGGHWCSGDAVHSEFGIGDAATGHRSQLLRVTNTSGQACRLGNYPDIAFDNAEGDAMNVLFYRGGSFMTEDDGPAAVILEPGSSATAELGWNAMATAGVPTPGTALVAPYAGAARARLPLRSGREGHSAASAPDTIRHPGERDPEVPDRERADPSPVLDITDGSAVAITAWAHEVAAGS